jgi:hypothetical protein
VTTGTAWGDIPTWVGAVGTLLAFAIALTIYAQAQSEQRKAQSRHVSGWVPGGPSLVPTGVPFAGTKMVSQGPRVEFVIMIRNGSEDLISDVEAVVLAVDGTDLGLGASRWTDIGPGQTIDMTTSVPDDGRVRGELRLRVAFTDSAGRRWERFGGSLRRI